MNPMLTLRAAAASFAVTMAAPAIALPQNPELVGSFRPYLFVLIAFAAGWVMIAAWVYRIGKKMREVSKLVEERSRGS